MAKQTENTRAVHEDIFRTLLQTPHREVDETLALHREQFERDPNLYGHIAVWAVLGNNCVTRDINEVFTSIMLTSPYQEHREAGYVMFQGLPPHQALRVMRQITGWDEVVKHQSFDPPMPINGQFGVSYTRAKYGLNAGPKQGQEIPRRVIKLGPKSKLGKFLKKKNKIPAHTREIWCDTWLVHHKGLGKRTVRGMLAHAIRSYLRVREANEGWMESALLRNANTFRTFYMRTHTLPQNDAAGWVNQYLFKGVAPEGSRLSILKQLAEEKDPAKQAELIVEGKLPMPVVTGLVKNITPSVIVALITVMSDQELLQSQEMLERYGAFDNDEIKALIQKRIEGAKTGKRVDALKGEIAAKAAKHLDAETRQKIAEVTDAQIKRHGTIDKRLAIGIDKSGSLREAIEAGKMGAAALAQACVEGNTPVAYLFDSIPTEITWTAADGDITKKSSWDRKLHMVQSQGATLPNTMVRAMIARKQIVDRIFLFTDEEENPPVGAFAQELKKYEAAFGILPDVVIVRVGPRQYDFMEKSLRALNIPVEVLPAKNIDQVSVPNLIKLASQKSIFELVLDILALPLPTRAEWDEANLKQATAPVAAN